MAKEHIFIVDDEADILELLRYNLSKEGYKITCVETGDQLVTMVKTHMPDLIILDLMLPGLDGLEVCGHLKKDPKTHHIPVVMLTAKGDEADIVTGLELGAEDYITKPFSPRVVLARIRAVFRRNTRRPFDDTSTIKIHELFIHPGRHEVLINGVSCALTFSEFKILHSLARRPGWVFTRNQIVDAVHGEDYPVTDRSIDVQIVGLRKKLGEYGDYIETVRGVGYKFKE